MNKYLSIILLFFVLSLFGAPDALGSGLKLDRSVRFSDIDDSGVTLNLGIMWENSWVDAYNYDAVWIFFKWRDTRMNEWSHVSLEKHGVTSDEYTCSPGLAGNGKTVGYFIYHDVTGIYTRSQTTLSVRWIFPAGVTRDMLENGEISVVGHGIEMIYVPFGSFCLGDGVSTNGFCTPGSNVPVVIASEGSVSVSTLNNKTPSASGTGYDSSLSSGSSSSSLASGVGPYGSGPCPADFPKGYNGFYSMKYELSQEQYAVFLNSLSRSAQLQLLGDRVMGLSRGSFLFGDGASVSFRNYIRVTEPVTDSRGAVFGFFASDLPGLCDAISGNVSCPLACNYLSTSDLWSYASWSGLRPMSELEYEKLCRRDVSCDNIPGGFAWGSVGYVPLAGLLDNGTISEHASSGNVHGGSGLPVISGPVRCGAFGFAASSREQSGASFSGAFELSGNVSEMCVSVSATTFRGNLHGDGSLGTFSVFSGLPVGLRGGSFASPADRLRVSDRGDMTPLSPSSRLNDAGFRLVRSVDASSVSINGGTVSGSGTYCSGVGFTLSGTVPASVSGIGGLDIRYEWYMDGGKIAGASGASLAFPRGLFNVPAIADRTYSFVRRAVTALGYAESNAVTLTVKGRSVLSVSPSSMNIDAASTISFMAEVQRASVLSWFLLHADGSRSILGSSSSVEPGASVSWKPSYSDFGNIPGTYFLQAQATTTSGCADSLPLSVTVKLNILPGKLSAPAKICQGEPLAITGSAGSFAGISEVSPSYTWYRDGIEIPSAKDASLTVLSGLKGGESYRFFRRSSAVDGSYADSDTASVFIERCPPLRPDGKAYVTVWVENTEWLAENLMNPSTCGESWDNAEYGRLYNWDAASCSCPAGWHLPSDEEWGLWITAFGSSGLGTKMKSTSGWDNGNNESGFNGLPGKGCKADGSPDTSVNGIYGAWWTSTLSGSTPRIRRLLDTSSAFSATTKNSGFGQSVRCVRDE